MQDLERLAAGVILVGFGGTALDEPLRALFSARQFAGYLLFARNVQSLEQVRRLTDELRQLHEVAPLLGVDQEGGRVMRLTDDVEPIPPMMAVGAAGRTALAENAGEQLAFDLRRAGFNIDFAPVVDLALDARNTVIGTRAFGNDPEITGMLGNAVVSGMQRGGIAATLKHFPGHGATHEDSHLGLPVVETDAATIRRRDLVPFVRGLKNASSVMTAHVIVRAFDSQHPATLSKAILTGLLRDELGFSGVCFTDCMQMDAISRSIGTAEGVASAIAAGADCALVSHDPALAAQAAQCIARDIRSGVLPYERLAQAYERVQNLRRNTQLPIAVKTPAPHPGIGREIARHAVTTLRGTPHVDPTAAMVISFEGETNEGAQGRHEHHISLQREAPALEALVAALEPDEEEQRAVVQRLEMAARRPVVLMRRAHVYPNQLQAVLAIVDRFPDTVVVSMREPYDCRLVGNARHLFAAYGDDDACIGAVADVLFGNVAPTGTLPVEFNG